MEEKTDWNEKNWKIVRNRVCVRALLIFLGVILMQLLAYMLCILGITVYNMLMGRGTADLLEKLSADNTQSAAFMIALSAVSAVLSGIWCGILYRKSSWRQKKFNYRRAFCRKNLLAAAGAGIGGCIVLTLLLNVLAAMLPHAFEAYSELMEPLMDGSVRLTVLYVLLIGPVSEELIFRGALLDRFHLAFPFLAANALQAALFGIYHMNLTQGVYAFCLGFVLGLIRYVTGSILANMLAHILFNATSYALDLFFPAGQAAQLAAIAAGAVLGCAWFVWSLRYLWKAAKRKEG